MRQPVNDSPRLREFEAALISRYGSYALEPTADSQLVCGRISDTVCGPLTISRIEVAGITSCRDELSSRWLDRAFLLMPRHGQLIVHHYGRTTTLGVSDMLLLDSRSGCSIASPVASSNLSVELERGVLAELSGGIEDLCGRRIPGGRGMGRVLANLISSIADDIDGCSSEDGATIQSIIVDLFARTLCGEIEEGARRAASTSVKRMRDWLVRQVQDPSLSPDRIAEEFGLSRRGLYRLFAATGTTPGKWLWQVRLECAHQRLASPGFRAQSIGEIAYSVGFNDSSHFARLFKRRFGMAPGEVRGRSVR